MGLLRERMKEEMMLRGFSEFTIRGYTQGMTQFAAFLRKSPLLANQADIRSYFLYLIRERKVSFSSIRMASCSLKFFLRMHGLQRLEESIPRMRSPFTLASVMNESELHAFFDALDDLRQRAIFLTIFCAGLRLGEACRLEVSDVDPERRQIKIRSSKGKKDRYTILFRENLEVLELYMSHYRPEKFLFFPLARPGQRMNARRVQEMFSRAKQRAGITKRATVHTLRHTFATRMLGNGVNLLVIQRLLGHSSIMSTMRYLHLTETAFSNIRSPLEGGFSADRYLLAKDQLLLAYSPYHDPWKPSGEDGEKQVTLAAAE